MLLSVLTVFVREGGDAWKGFWKKLKFLNSCGGGVTTLGQKGLEIPAAVGDIICGDKGLPALALEVVIDRPKKPVCSFCGEQK
jgi:hypothetical protein